MNENFIFDLLKIIITPIITLIIIPGIVNVLKFINVRGPRSEKYWNHIYNVIFEQYSSIGSDESIKERFYEARSRVEAFNSIRLLGVGSIRNLLWCWTVIFSLISAAMLATGVWYAAVVCAVLMIVCELLALSVSEFRQDCINILYMAGQEGLGNLVRSYPQNIIDGYFKWGKKNKGDGREWRRETIMSRVGKKVVGVQASNEIEVFRAYSEGYRRDLQQK